MLPLAVGLALAAAAPAPQVQTSTAAPSIGAPAKPPCADLDPGLVHHVAPPEGKGPVWAVGQAVAPGPPKLAPRSLDFGPATKARGSLVLPAAGCPRLVPTSAG